MPWFPFRVRHPFYPGLAGTQAAASAGQWEALAGTFQELRNAALRGARARHAIFILTRNGVWPGKAKRDELWQLFQVPSYVIWLDGQGRQLGWECEAQDGLHVAEGWGGCHAGFRLETAPCACGRPGARLVRDKEEEAARSEARSRIPVGPLPGSPKREYGRGPESDSAPRPQQSGGMGEQDT